MENRKVTRGLLFYRIGRWMHHGEYDHIERRVIQALIFSTTLLLLSGVIRAILG